MKKFLLFLAVFIFSSAAKAELNPYLALRGGWEYSNQTYHAYVPPPPFPQRKGSGGNLFDAKGATVSAAAGLKFSHALRMEFAYTFKNLSEKDNMTNYDPRYESERELKVEQHTFLINAFYYPFKEFKVLNPFVGAGIGTGKFIEKHKPVFDFLDTKTNFCFMYALYLGTDINITKNFAIELFGIYNSMPNPKYAYSNSTSLYEYVNPPDNYGFNLGLRYTF